MSDDLAPLLIFNVFSGVCIYGLFYCSAVILFLTSSSLLLLLCGVAPATSPLGRWMFVLRPVILFSLAFFSGQSVHERVLHSWEIHYL